MSGVYVYSEKLTLAAELIGFGKMTGESVYAIAFSREDAETLAQCGADGILFINGDLAVVENNARGVAALLKQREANLILVGATSRGRDFASRIAGYMDCAMASDVNSIEVQGGVVSTTRTMYGGAVIEEADFAFPVAITIPAGKFDSISGESHIEEIEVPTDSRVKLVKNEPISKEGTDLSTARSIVALGMGVEKHEDVTLIQDLADQLGAELGCTRGIAEERRWIPVEQYVGLSGVSVSPDLYLTVGVSGQVQHVVGIRDSKIIVAIDKNAQAPIFKSCDYGIVGDLYEVVPLLTEMIKTKK